MFNMILGQTSSKINGNLSFRKCMSAVTRPAKMRVPVVGFPVHQKVYWKLFAVEWLRIVGGM
jgi:hypothetical protein